MHGNPSHVIFPALPIHFEVGRTPNSPSDGTPGKCRKPLYGWRLCHGHPLRRCRTGPQGRGRGATLWRCPVRASRRVGMCTSRNTLPGVAPGLSVPCGKAVGTRKRKRASRPVGPRHRWWPGSLPRASRDSNHEARFRWCTPAPRNKRPRVLHSSSLIQPLPASGG